MSERIKLDPLTRIEGHLKLEFSVEGGTISDAKSIGTMYRGFENFLKGRHPFDAVRITQRVCGVCHEVHGVASCMALEKLYRLNPPVNGVILRDMILGLSIISDHILHFYQLMLPDYADFSKLSKSAHFLRDNKNAKLITAQTAGYEITDNYIKAIKTRSRIGEALAVIGAKTPFCHALLPGGVTTSITPDKLLKIRSVLSDVSDFLNETMKTDTDLLAVYFDEYFEKGVSPGRYICGSSFSVTGKNLYNAGVYADGKISEMDIQNISESISKTFLNSKNEPDAQKNGAYSWIKTPSYKGRLYEVGPIARMVVNDSRIYKDMMKSYGADYRVSSAMSRIAARAAESLEIVSHLQQILGEYTLNKSTITNPDLSVKPTGEGYAVSIASRGMLFHRVNSLDGRIVSYDLIVPSSWNFGPGTDAEQGIVESALNGTDTGREDRSVVAGRIVRSFDPCMACAVH